MDADEIEVSVVLVLFDEDRDDVPEVTTIKGVETFVDEVDELVDVEAAVTRVALDVFRVESGLPEEGVWVSAAPIPIITSRATTIPTPSVVEIPRRRIILPVLHTMLV